MNDAIQVSLENMTWKDDAFAAFHACIDALEDLCDLAATPECSRLAFQSIIQHVVELSPRISIICIAFEAGKPFGFIKPTEDFLVQLLAATAGHFDQLPLSVVFRHGWPILSLDGVATPSLTEAGAASSRSGGGMA